VANLRADRVYEYWAPEEDSILRREQHRTVRELARMLGRRQGAIRSRLHKLGLAETLPARRRRPRGFRRGATRRRSGASISMVQPSRVLVERSVVPRSRRWVAVLAVVAALAVGFVIGRATAPPRAGSTPHGTSRNSGTA
jgi:hypothetical protein